MTAPNPAVDALPLRRVYRNASRCIIWTTNCTGCDAEFPLGLGSEAEIRRFINTVPPVCMRCSSDRAAEAVGVAS